MVLGLRIPDQDLSKLVKKVCAVAIIGFVLDVTLNVLYIYLSPTEEFSWMEPIVQIFSSSWAIVLGYMGARWSNRLMVAAFAFLNVFCALCLCAGFAYAVHCMHNADKIVTSADQERTLLYISGGMSIPILITQILSVFWASRLYAELKRGIIVHVPVRVKGGPRLAFQPNQVEANYVAIRN